MTKQQIFEFFERLAQHDPSPTTELKYGNAYQLVVAVALSAQATDVGVNKATRALFEKVETPQQMLDLGLEDLIKHIRTIGLFNSKAKNVIKLSQMLIDDYGGEVPNTREDLQRLPGVGRKTANVVLNCWFGQETFAVDTHIFRVGNRTGLAKGKTPDHVEAKLDKRVPEPFRLHAHNWLILHGRYTCKARTPECWRCELTDLCSFRKKVLKDPRPGAKGRENTVMADAPKTTPQSARKPKSQTPGKVALEKA